MHTFTWPRSKFKAKQGQWERTVKVIEHSSQVKGSAERSIVPANSVLTLHFCLQLSFCHKAGGLRLANGGLGCQGYTRSALRAWVLAWVDPLVLQQGMSLHRPLVRF